MAGSLDPLRRRMGFRWDGVVTLGNVLTLITMLCSMAGMAIGVIVWGLKLEGRADKVAADLVRVEAEMRREQDRDARALVELKTLIMQQGVDTRNALAEQGKENRDAIARIMSHLLTK